MEKFLTEKKHIIIVLSLILLVGFLLRIWQLGKIPLSPDWDEVALGYDAYSISETGRDEYGKFLPVVLRSFDDYKPALYAYLIVPAYKIFGLNIFVVRLPSAIIGVLAIIAVYFFTKELFQRRDIAILSSGLLAISPWHIQFSRIAFESNVGLALNIFAATFFIYGLRKNWLLILSSISAGLSLYAYQSEKVFTPLFMLGLAIIFLNSLIKIKKKYLILAFFTGLIVILPMVVNIFTDKQSLLRAKGTSIFNNSTVVLRENSQRTIYNLKVGNGLGQVVDNRRVVYAKTIIGNYLSHFSPNWLLRGDIARHHAPDMGLIYIWELPFILIGVYVLIFSKFSKRTKLTIFYWFLLAPVPASITTGVPHAVRTLNFLPTWQVFISLGLIGTFSFLHNIKLRVLGISFIKLFSCFLFIFVAFNFVYYINQYFVQQNYFHAFQWQYGYEQIVSEVKNRYTNFDKIIVTDKEPLDKSYMFFLFYLQYPPSKYQESGQQAGGYATHQRFDKYEFRPIRWDKDSHLKKTLFVGNPIEFPDSISSSITVFYPDGSPAIVMVENK